MLKCAVPFLNPAYSSSMISSGCGCSRVKVIRKTLARMTYQADGVIVTAIFQISFLWERDDDCVHAEGQVPGFQTSLHNFM